MSVNNLKICLLMILMILICSGLFCSGSFDTSNPLYLLHDASAQNFNDSHPKEGDINASYYFPLTDYFPLTGFIGPMPGDYHWPLPVSSNYDQFIILPLLTKEYYTTPSEPYQVPNLAGSHFFSHLTSGMSARIPITHYTSLPPSGYTDPYQLLLTQPIRTLDLSKGRVIGMLPVTPIFPITTNGFYDYGPNYMYIEPWPYSLSPLKEPSYRVIYSRQYDIDFPRGLYDDLPDIGNYFLM